MDNERTDDNNSFIDYLKTFVENSEKEISDLKSKLEWLDNDSSLEKNGNTCVHNPQHTNIAERNFDKHLAKCSFLSKNDFAEHFKQTAIDSNHQIEIDDHVLGEILSQDTGLLESIRKPRLADNNHYLVNHLSTHLRLRVHDYAVQRFRSDKTLDFTHDNRTFLNLDDLKAADNKNDPTSLSHRQLYAEIRNRKRRPKSYRKPKQTQTDKLRDLIEVQMDILSELSKEIEKINKKTAIKSKDSQFETKVKSQRTEEKSRKYSRSRSKERKKSKHKHCHRHDDQRSEARK